MRRALIDRMTPGRSVRGFSLVELLTSIVIVGVLISVFYSVFILNWKAMEDYSVRSGLWQDMDVIIDQITLDARESAQINVSADQKDVSMLNRQSAVIAAYAFTAGGMCQVTRSGVTTTLTNSLDYALSTFRKNGESLVVNVVLSGDVLGREVSIDASTEIYPRN